MAPPRRVDPEKAAKYAIAASKGFSYYLPKSAQRHLQELLKKLPSTARSIYDEYYRDLMCAKACAPESAAAMAEFVTESFSMVARKHNAFAKEMNEEIDNNEHEGYVPVMFPIVPEPEVQLEEDAATPSKSKKRKRASAKTTTLPLREATPNKKAKTKSDAQPAMSPALPSPSLTHITDSDVPSSTQPQPTRTEPPSNTAGKLHTDDAPPLTQDPNHVIDIEQHISSGPLNWHSRGSSPLPDPPPSEGLGTEDNITEESQQHTHHGYDGKNLEPHTNQADATIDELEDCASKLTPATPLPDVPSSKALDNPDLIMGDSEQSVADNDHNDSKEQSWEDGMQAIGAFHWDRPGSRWEPGRGLVSIYYDDVEKSGKLFRGNYWDDESEEATLEAISLGTGPEKSMEYMS